MGLVVIALSREIGSVIGLRVGVNKVQMKNTAR